MFILAVEASSALGSVALFENDQPRAFASSTNQRAHSEFLNPAVDECLQKVGISIEDIDLYACAKGPGSFTGIRVAANIIKSFSYLNAKPMVTCDSFEILHQQNQATGPQAFIMNAHKNLVYTALYDDSRRVLEPCAISIANFELQISANFPDRSKINVFGDGYTVFNAEFSPALKSRFSRSISGHDYPSAESLGHLAYLKWKSNQTIEWNNYLPLYIRASEAEENLRVK